MAIPFFKVYHTPVGGTEQEITELIQLNDSRGLEIKSARASLKINNSPFRDKVGGESIFKEDGAIEIYADYSPITRTNAQILLAGKIRKLDVSYGEGNSQYKITAADNTVIALGSIWNKTYNGSTPAEIIQSIMANSPVQGAVTTTNVATVNSVGGSFDTPSDFNMSNKPIFDWVSELSQTGYTGDDRAYIFYVDKDNDLHWFYPSQTSSGTIEEGTDDIYSMTLTRNSDEVINLIFFNAGSDLLGNGVGWYYHDKTSKTNELRMKYQPMTDLSGGSGGGVGLFDAEITAGNLTLDTAGTVPYKGLLYTPDASGTTSWGVAFADFDAYQAAFRARLKFLGEERGAKITAAFGKLLWKGNVVLKGTNTYTAGDLITFTSRTLGLSNQLLRIQDVVHSFQKTGWTTTIQLKEDEEAVTAAI
jgi:hypothetical protein